MAVPQTPGVLHQTLTHMRWHGTTVHYRSNDKLLLPLDVQGLLNSALPVCQSVLRLTKCMAYFADSYSAAARLHLSCLTPSAQKRTMILQGITTSDTGRVVITKNRQAAPVSMQVSEKHNTGITSSCCSGTVSGDKEQVSSHRQGGSSAARRCDSPDGVDDSAEEYT